MATRIGDSVAMAVVPELVDPSRSRGMVGPGGVGSPVGGIGVKPAPKKATPTRTEFIVIFVWKEWTPSDSLIKGAEVPPSTGQ